MIQPDMSIVKITESGQHEVNPYDFNLESSDEEETNSKIKQEEKMKSHQSDRYANKMMGQGLFILGGSDTFDTTHVSSEQSRREDKKKETEKNLSKPEIDYYSSKVRIGLETNLPSMKKLSKAELMNHNGEDSLGKVSQQHKELLNNPEVKWKVTKYKPS